MPLKCSPRDARGICRTLSSVLALSHLGSCSVSCLFSQTFLFLLIIFHAKSHVGAVDCPYNVEYLVPAQPQSLYDLHSANNSASAPQVDIGTPTVELLENTFDCSTNLANAITNVTELESCEEADLDVDFYTHAVLPNGTNIMPYVKLNVSIMTFTPVESLFIQFRCVHAPDHEDKYCHDHSSQIARWGRMIWPCRELRVLSSAGRSHADNETDRNSTSIIFPLRFSYNCFNLFGLSQYEVNVTILPKLCRSTRLLTIPIHRQLDTRIRDFYPRASTDWSPLVYADLSLPDNIWLRFQRHNDTSRPQTPVIVKVLERFASGHSSRLAHTERLAANESGFRWENVPAGDYFVFVYSERYDCQLSCEDLAPGGCRICPHTMLNFTVPVDKYTIAYSRMTTVISIVKALVLSVFVALTLIVVALLITLVYVRIWRPYQMAHRPAQNFELKERPTILIVYTDDCEEHSAAVHSLADLLTEYANANVLLDQFALQDPSVRPSIWLLNAISEAQYVLLIFSECSTRVLNGGTLRQRRPFPDMFSSAISYVIAKINSINADHPASCNDASNAPKKKWDLRARLGLILNPEQSLPFLSSSSPMPASSTKQSALSRFIVARFSYSPASVVPEFFAADVFGGLCLPADLGLLVARLHGVISFGDRSTARHRFECAANKDELNQQIAAFEAYTAANPDWAEDRFENESSSEYNDANFRLNECLERLAPNVGNTTEALTMDEKTCEKYGLSLLPISGLDGEDDDDELDGNDDERINGQGNAPVENGLPNKNVDEMNGAASSQPRRFELIGNPTDFCSSSSSLSSS